MMRRILVLFVFFISYTQTARTQQDRFYSPSHGLSGTLIQGMTEDSRGYLWISTYSGLNRFDGYNFKVYQFTAEDTTSINSTDVYETLEDSRGNLWVGTNTGFNRYDYQLDCFKRISFPSLPDSLELEVNDILEGPDRNIWLITSYGLVCLNPETLESDFFNTRFDNDGVPSPASFTDAVFDPSGNIWIITRNQGVLVFNPEERKFYTLSGYVGFDDEYLNKTGSIREIKITPKGEILIGERNALIVYDFNKKKFSLFPFSKANNGEDSGGVYSISQEKNGEIWVGTVRGGLYRVDRLNHCLTETNSAIQMEDIDKSRIICYVGPSGNTWYGVQYRGIYLKVPSLQPFHAIHGFKSGGNNLSHPLIQSILKDHNGTLWVGTDGGGLNYRTEGESKFHPFDRMVNPDRKVSVRVVMSLLEDSRGWIWAGTYMEGLYCYRGDGTAPVRYPLIDPDFNMQQLNIYDIKEDHLGNLWIGTLGSGLFYLDVEKGVVRSYKKPVVKGTAREIDPYVNDILLISDGTVWIATYDGLFAWNEKKEFFREFSTTTTEDMDNDAIFTLVEDDAHDIWFGSFSGLFHLDQNGHIVKKYTTEDGLPNNTVMSLRKDGRGGLWISTTNGLSRLDIKGGFFRNFYEYDGLPCNEFKPGSSFRDDHGNMYFGGVNGLVYFHPDSIQESRVSPALLLTHFRIFDKDIHRGTLADGRVILSKSINETDTIFLHHKDNSFTFEFAAIDFLAPEKIKYAVMMEGFDKNWVTKDYQQRYATYTNLSPGSYIFKINSTNRDGVWSERPREILVIISPPFWRTWWAYGLYGVLLFALFFFLRSILLFRLRMRNQLHFEQMERVKQEEISRSKMQFLSNISHEIKTPLTMIMAPLEKLTHTSLDEAQRKQFSFIQKSAQRLLSLFNQLLEVQKIEDGQWKLKAQRTEMVEFLREIVTLFEGAAEEKKIEISFETVCDELEAWVDRSKMDTVVFNLLSNALKFTPQKGLITLSVSLHPEESKFFPLGFFEISVADTGIGISEEHLTRIFERFYQVEMNDSECQAGTGIGLHLVKQLVDMHHGSIHVDSRKGEGSLFVLRFPLGDQAFKAEELSGAETMQRDAKHSWILSGISSLEKVITQEGVQHEPGDARSVILVIEDDPDILNYIESEFLSEFDIIKANDGNEGWNQAVEKLPDLIISDVMMPGLDGISLCRKIKSTFETSHIPVILLTASSSVEKEIEGYETGADAYIHKPFHPSLLELKVKKIIETREGLKHQFSKGFSFIAREMVLTSADEKFLQRAIDYVKDHLADSTLSTEQMSKYLGISRVHLYRKLKALTNQVPTEFIRTIRLKQAAYLLAQKKLNISEIAYKVGFNSHQYFTNSFQKYYNMSPTEYSKQKENE